MWWLSLWLNPYTRKIMECYKSQLPLYDTIPIGFTGAANEQMVINTHEVDADQLICGFNIDKSNVNLLIRIRSQAPRYEWMVNNDPLPQDTPIAAVCGIATNVQPVLPVPVAFFVAKQGKLIITLTNSPSAASSDGNLTYVGVRLVNPINGGYKYGD